MPWVWWHMPAHKGRKLLFHLAGVHAFCQFNKGLPVRIPVAPMVELDLVPQKAVFYGNEGDKLPKAKIGIFIPILYNSRYRNLQRVVHVNVFVKDVFANDVFQWTFPEIAPCLF